MNTTRLGIVGILAVTVLLASALLIPQGWYLIRTAPYTAQFAHAGGLTEADPVFLAGVPAGRVDSVELAGDHVDVHFRLDRDQPLGDRTHAAVKLRTILGKRYLEIVPDGSGPVGDDRTIPTERTSVPYSLDDIGTEVRTVAEELDVSALESMVTTLRETVPEDSSVMSDALTGISAASEVLARNDDKIASLLDVAQSLTSTVAAESQSMTTLLGNAQLVLSTLSDRRTALGRLVTDLRTLIGTASAFLDDNADELDRLLVDMTSVTDTLERNGQNIDTLLTTLPPALRAVTDATGNGNWVDVSAPAGPIPDNLLCSLGVQQGCTR
ncbi:virulence factor Mce [Rhodococcus sp. RS1C4]|uniref:MCE family protein n=1 Tax=Rhodococcoides fascians TaxID=1828 RepID=UPI00036E2B1E|nr:MULTISPECIES: MCE family protein [Rhodococcus]OZC52876.1 virulence factor Mce [Rhodococcus sp. RS1C4]OZC77412.1 virulence factor Mce [Rhodococcus sp. 06-418-1B]OZC77777.1 virulence factor Mce [Rhodococcus sp. 06-418-1B]